MDTNQKSQVENWMHSLDDHALLRVISIEASNYEPEALQVAREELHRRKVNILSQEQYLAKFPSEKIAKDGFCAKCHDETTDESPGDTRTVNFILGTRLIGHDDRCPTCGSVLQTKWWQFFLPLIPVGKYRVIYIERALLRNRYIGRRLRERDSKEKFGLPFKASGDKFRRK
jgi:hypothetical protein